MSKLRFVIGQEGPGAKAGRFIEVENHGTGESVKLGEWERLPNGCWALVFDHFDVETVIDKCDGKL